MAKIKVTLVKSPIGCKKDQIAAVKGVGRKKIRDEKIQEATHQINGMVSKVSHLVKAEEI